MDKRLERLSKRFWKFTKKTDRCWLWLGYKNPKGYGRMNEKRKTNYAHRFSYELHKGKISKDLHIDHLCRNTSCVNPEHLEAVTPRENILRGESIFAKQARQTHCKHGHELNEENTFRYGNHRKCKICSRHHDLIRHSLEQYESTF